MRNYALLCADFGSHYGQFLEIFAWEVDKMGIFGLITYCLRQINCNKYYMSELTSNLGITKPNLDEYCQIFSYLAILTWKFLDRIFFPEMKICIFHRRFRKTLVESALFCYLMRKLLFLNHNSTLIQNNSKFFHDT